MGTSFDGVWRKTLDQVGKKMDKLLVTFVSGYNELHVASAYTLKLYFDVGLKDSLGRRMKDVVFICVIVAPV